MTAADEVVGITRDLIRFDTSNYGDGSGPCERSAAEYVQGLLQDVGLEPELVESGPRRANVVARWEGRDPERPPLVLHGHTDVVPAVASDWQVDPFAAEVRDGMIWGRGAVDMKNMDAMILSVVRQRVREGRTPARDVVVAMFADEESGGRWGSHWMVDNRPEVFHGATEAISEVGGYSVEVGGRRAYLLQTAEKGMAWLRLVSEGQAGHGSQVSADNAVVHLAGAVARVGAHRWPMRLVPEVNLLLQGVARLTGLPWDPEDEDAVDALVDALGPAARFVAPTLRNTSTPTGLSGGYKMNVVPGRAEATVDCRFLPGEEAALMDEVRRLAGPDVRVETEHRDLAVQAPVDGALVRAMTEAVQDQDPDGEVLPYVLSAGTDNKALAGLGIAGYGFAPLRLPADMDFPAMFHGVDERVPVDALAFGTRVLDRLLDLA
jgi:acetylornithine deacetylase/succinyl-diaminopimelate desuccinylase-like protein